MKIRTLIVDDMLLARKRIRRYLSKDSEIEIIAECSNGQEAIKAIAELQPELVFLDVQMPETNGFDVLKSVYTNKPPTFIFVTAHDQFAIKAFEVNAFDYLLKPFSEDRLAETLKRVKKKISTTNLPSENHLFALLSELKAESQYISRLTVKERGKIIFVPVAEIEYIEAQGNYLELIHGASTHLIRMRLHQLEAKLNPAKFIRIHRSTIVNIDRIKELYPLFNGDQTVIMQNGKKLTMTRNYRESLKFLLGNF